MLGSTKLRNIQFVGILATVLTITAVFYFTNPWAALQSTDSASLFLACSLYGLSVCLWSGVWVLVLARSSGSGWIPRSGAVSMASNVGVLTPLNIGTDLLRSYYGKQVLALGYGITAAASVVTRTFKLHVTLALLVVAAIVSVSSAASVASAALVPVVTVVVLLGALYSLRTRASARLARRLNIGDLSGPIARTNRELRAADATCIYIAFIAGFALEWLSLHLCFIAIDLATPFADTLTVFVLLYVLSRTPGIPQGLGVVEVSGFAVLSSMNLAIVEVGAILVMWDFVRIVVPLGLALLFSLTLGRPPPLGGRGA